MKRNVLITGGSGLFALNSSVSLSEKFNCFLALHNKKINVPWAKTTFIDLQDKIAIHNFLKKFEIDIIIHAAGMTDVIGCEENKKKAYSANVLTTMNLVEVSLKFDIEFVLISTDHLFNGCTKFVDENTTPNPLNYYAKTKHFAELVVRKNIVKSYIIRTNFFGWGTSYRVSFSDFVIDKLRLNIITDYYENIFYTPILVETLTNKIYKLITHHDTNNKYGIWNICGDERITKLDFALLVANIFEFDKSFINPSRYTINSDLTRPLDMSLSCSKINKFLDCQERKVTKDLIHLKEQLNYDKYNYIRNL